MLRHPILTDRPVIRPTDDALDQGGGADRPAPRRSRSTAARAPATRAPRCCDCRETLKAPVVVRLPRQGRARGRQPVRGRDDRAARLGRRHRGAGRLRPAAHARHRLPVPRVPAVREDDHPGRRQAAAPRSAGGRRPRARRRRRRDAAGPDPAARGTRTDTHVPRQDRQAPPQEVEGHPDLRHPRGQRRGPAARDGGDRAERPRRGRRRLHRRHRHVQRLGRPLPADEAGAPDPRVVQPRLDGQRHAAGDRRQGRLARTGR